MTQAQRYARLHEFFGLAGTRVLVTGGGSGMGAASCRLLAEVGAKVAVADVDLARASVTAEDIVSNDGEARSFHVDLAQESSVVSCVDSAVTWLGGLDVLVHGAGIYPRISFMAITADQWDRIHDVNARGTLFVMRAALKEMIRGGSGGSIVNFSSAGSLRNVVYDHPAYASSKAAVNSLTRSAALEFAVHGIRVNAILPGIILSSTATASMEGKSNPPRGPLLDPGRIPLGRPGQVDDVSGLVLFLAGPASRYMTGQLLEVDGGFGVS